MPAAPDPDSPAWDQFLGFVSPADVPATGAEAEAELRKLGVDVRPAQARVLAAVRQARAKQALEAARAKLGSVKAALAVVPTTRERLTRERLKELIAERCDDATRLAYFRKLDATSSDEDYQALLDDFARLELVTQADADAQKPAE